MHNKYIYNINYNNSIYYFIMIYDSYYDMKIYYQYNDTLIVIIKLNGKNLIACKLKLNS